MSQCDFCSSKEAKWEFPAEVFTIEIIGWRSKDKWAACDSCHDFIQAESYTFLLYRAVQHDPQFIAGVYVYEELEGLNMMLQLQFRLHRKGEPMPIIQEEENGSV